MTHRQRPLTPVEIVEAEDFDGGITHRIIHRDGVGGTYRICQIKDKAAAKFLVLAWNTHDDLISAAATTLRFIRGLGEYIDGEKIDGLKINELLSEVLRKAGKDPWVNP